MKKNTIILLIAALFAGSCVENLKFEPEPENETINFSWYATRSMATKADPKYFVGDATATGTERHLNSGTSMGVFGYFHPQNSGVAGTWQHGAGVYNTPNLFYNEAVSITENSGTYTYDYANYRYWPRNKLDKISFFAYYPWNSLNTSGSASENTIVEPFLDTKSEREGLVGFYYVVPEASDKQVDFMVSDLCLEQSKALWSDNSDTGLTGNANGKVKFFFHHALSQIRVKSVNFDNGGNTDVTVKINYILFRNVAVYGQCIPVADFNSTTATGRTPVTPTWPAGSLVDRRPDLSSGVKTEKVCYDASADTWSVENFLLMIPHTFADEAAIEVNFDIVRKTADTGEYYSYKGNNLSAPLKTASVEGWQAGKIYTYNIKLDLKQIKVTADVVDWLPADDDVIMDKNETDS